MAHRRMISQDIVDTDNFAEMPQSARYLYYELLIRADDDGFLGAPMRIVRMVGCTESDLNELVDNGYIIRFETGIIVIRDWKVHNSVRKDMYQKTMYQDELSMLCEVEKRYYLKSDCNVTDNVTDNVTYNVTDNVTYNVTDNVTRSVTLGKDRIGKDRIGKNNTSIIGTEPDKSAPNPSGILLPLNDKSFYDVPLDKIATWQQAYPAVEIKQELQKMRAWLESNPTRCKTRRGIDRFINTWLSREQDKGGIYRSGSRQREELSTEEALARHRTELSFPECPDGPFK